MEVTVRLFAMLRERAGASEIKLELPDGASVRDALDELGDIAAGLPLVMAVNREYAPEGSIHVGASGVVFGFATYLIARGWFNRRTGQIAIGLVVVVVWGGVLLGGLQPREGISWQGHLFGAIGGLVAAWALRGPAERRSVASVV